ncbi:MAG: sulfite exporter TauE/SafE family protein [Steroidobacteraceae bacterium]
MLHYAVIFAAGFAGSFHCAGMCGGFACGLAPDPRGRLPTILRRLAYNSGRVVTYSFLGALTGAFGQLVIRSSHLGVAQSALAMFAGLLMILMALQLYGWLPAAGHGGGTATIAKWLPGLRRILVEPGYLPPLAFGVLNGFLPCPLVAAFLARSATTGTPLSGATLMIAFGLGTFPAMLLLATLGPLFKFQWRRRGVQVAGAFILLLGVVTLLRAFALPAHGHWHPIQ